MLCPSRNFKTQKPSLKHIEDAEGLLAILRTNSLNVNKSSFHVLRSAVRRVLTPKSPNFFDSTICPIRESVSNILNDPDEEIYDEEIFELPVDRFPFPRRRPQMPEPNKLIL